MNPLFDPSQLPLRDIHLPAPIGWWPPAPGWWLLIAVVLGVIWLTWRHWRRNVPRRAALKELARIVAALERGDDPARCLQQASTVVRRFAMTTAAQPAAVAGLCGERWLAFLDDAWRQARFRASPGRHIATAPYRPAGSVSSAQALELGALCARWVRAQKVGR